MPVKAVFLLDFNMSDPLERHLIAAAKIDDWGWKSDKIICKYPVSGKDYEKAMQSLITNILADAKWRERT